MRSKNRYDGKGERKRKVEEVDLEGKEEDEMVTECTG